MHTYMHTQTRMHVENPLPLPQKALHIVAILLTPSSPGMQIMVSNSTLMERTRFVVGRAASTESRPSVASRDAGKASGKILQSLRCQGTSQ